MGAALRLFVAGAVVGGAGLIGAVANVWLSPAGSAALVLTVLVTGLLAVPLAAVRLGKLPVPVPTPVLVGTPEPERPDRERVFAAVIRADELLTGALTGVALGALLADVLLVRAGTAGPVLVAVAAGALLLRARVFLAVRQRLPLLLAGAGGIVLLLAAAPLSSRVAVPVAGLLILAALVLVLAGATYRRHAPGPYLGRAADILDALCVVSVIPAACAVLGLYSLLAHLAP